MSLVTKRRANGGGKTAREADLRPAGRGISSISAAGHWKCGTDALLDPPLALEPPSGSLSSPSAELKSSPSALRKVHDVLDPSLVADDIRLDVRLQAVKVAASTWIGPMMKSAVFIARRPSDERSSDRGLSVARAVDRGDGGGFVAPETWRCSREWEAKRVDLKTLASSRRRLKMRCRLASLDAAGLALRSGDQVPASVAAGSVAEGVKRDSAQGTVTAVVVAVAATDAD